ncbi:hypothetical protein B4599_07510 [Xanthomonas oryzae pv. oryzae]|nr:hypothetical protein B4599_07510 [Xanthomonas oryzae pv. oryzae]
MNVGGWGDVSAARSQEVQSCGAGRLRGALTARGTGRESIHGGSMAASMPPSVPQAARTPP